MITLDKFKQKKLLLGEPDKKKVEEAVVNDTPPAMLLLKRKAVRVFPNGERVALYYAQNINKYISIPYDSKGRAVIANVKEEHLRSLQEVLCEAAPKKEYRQAKTLVSKAGNYTVKNRIIQHRDSKNYYLAHHTNHSIPYDMDIQSAENKADDLQKDFGGKKISHVSIEPKDKNMTKTLTTHRLRIHMKEDLSESAPKWHKDETMMSNYRNKTENVPIHWLKNKTGNDLRYDVSDLSHDIKHNGVKEPAIITVGKHSRTAKVGEGNHRIAAAEKAGFTHFPARVIVGHEYSKGTANIHHDLIPQDDEYFKADARPSEVFKSLNKKLDEAVKPKSKPKMKPKAKAPAKKAVEKPKATNNMELLKHVAYGKPGVVFRFKNDEKTHRTNTNTARAILDVHSRLSKENQQKLKALVHHSKRNFEKVSTFALGATGNNIR